jgi:hypothetical protein
MLVIGDRHVICAMCMWFDIIIARRYFSAYLLCNNPLTANDLQRCRALRSLKIKNPH